MKSILDLSLSLAKAQFKLRNEGTYLGIFWYLLDPLFLFLILVFLGPFLGITSQSPNYAVYLLLGLVMFNFFSQATIFSIDYIKNNKRFIKSIKIPYESLVLACFFQNLLSHFFEIAIFFVIAFFLGISILNIFYYFIILVFLGMFILGLSFVFSTVGVYITDFSNVWRVIARLLWFLTPIFYFVDKKYEAVFMLNPMYYFIEGARSMIIYNELPGSKIILGIIFLSLIPLLIGLLIFKKYKYRFAELV